MELEQTNGTPVSFNDILADKDDDSRFFISLSKLTGQKIKDVIGHLSTEFGEVTFVMTDIVLENGKKFSAEGEHDMPYLTWYEAIENMDEDTLKRLYQEMENDEGNYDNKDDEDNTYTDFVDKSRLAELNMLYLRGLSTKSEELERLTLRKKLGYE